MVRTVLWHTPSLRLFKGLIKHILERLLFCNADIWDFPSGLEVFLHFLLLRADTNGSAFCGSLIFLERAVRRPQSTLATENSRHLRLLASMIVTRKYFENDAYNTPFWTGIVAGTQIRHIGLSPTDRYLEYDSEFRSVFE
ncbi:hypothetical protein CGCS363_v015051 [Colletotrichum siamense]|uniref:uncharacterized protein n=1 Tax=Colletotrichum siamense TaxID=690259 RepID=UPI001872C9C7|nr:uncharacterized protein CGCS363_v015051 [Colletotrichum siamense]KAF5483042.1 hypothetical protein CGCS363_v015051 [Colletotrichum siamense]